MKRTRANHKDPLQHRPFTFRKRKKIPRYWCNIAGDILASGAAEGVTQIISVQREYLWHLVLSAKGIPHKSSQGETGHTLYVPPVLAPIALHEITEFEHEKPAPPIPAPLGRANALLVLLLLFSLVVWHILRWGTAKPSWLPTDPMAWIPLAGLDAYKTIMSGQWWRSITALTLHADAGHLASNITLGFLFCVPLCRRTGLGIGFLLVLLGGGIGNLITALIRPARSMSIGFSTAVFASIGLLAAVIAVEAYRHTRMVAAQTQSNYLSPTWQALRQAMLPLGAGLGFLALLGGSEAPNVDYLAHCMGLFSGLCLGFIAATPVHRSFSLPTRRQYTIQAGAMGMASGLILYAWHAALRCF